MSERPPPPVTITAPDRGTADADVLVGGASAARAQLPLRLRAIGLAAVAVLGAGIAVVVQEPVVDPPAAQPISVGVPGVTAAVELVEEGELVTGLSVILVLRDDSAGRGDSNGGPVPVELRLVDITARGFQVRLRSGALPLRLGAVGRFGSGQQDVVPLATQVVVTDCSVDVGTPRRITLSLRRDDGPVGMLAAQAGPGVVRALDDLVRRTCRRPRG